MTGFRFEFLCPLLRASADEWLPFENLAVAIGTGEVPAWVREVLSLGRATALKKAATEYALWSATSHCAGSLRARSSLQQERTISPTWDPISPL